MFKILQHHPLIPHIFRFQQYLTIHMLTISSLICSHFFTSLTSLQNLLFLSVISNHLSHGQSVTTCPTFTACYKITLHAQYLSNNSISLCSSNSSKSTLSCHCHTHFLNSPFKAFKPISLCLPTSLMPPTSRAHSLL